MKALRNRRALRNCPTTLQGPRIPEYPDSTFKKGYDADATLLPGPENWT